MQRFLLQSRVCFKGRPVAYLPITLSALAMVAGVAGQLLQPVLWRLTTYAVICGVAVLLAAFAGCARHVWGWCLALAVFGFSSTGWRAGYYAQQQLSANLEGRNIVVEGTIVGLPRQTDEGIRFVFSVQQATLNGETVTVPKRLSLGWYFPRQWGSAAQNSRQDTVQKSANALQQALVEPQDAVETASIAGCRACIEPGRRWRMTVRLKQVHGNRNPFGFDYELLLWEQGIGATGYVRNGRNDTPPEPLGREPWYQSFNGVHNLRLQVRQAIDKKLLASAAELKLQPQAQDQALQGSTLAPQVHSTHQQRRAGVIAALVMGEQSAIEREDWDIFRTTGVAHLLSISGLHITLFALVASSVLGWLWQKGTRYGARWGMPLCLWCPAPQVALWGGVLLACAYAAFSGWGVPAQRTACMLLTVACLRSSGRQWPWYSVLAVAAAVVVLFDPWALMQAGFWLSFVAVAVLFASSNSVPTVAGVWQGIRRITVAFLQQQRIVFLALSPLSLLLFAQVSLVGILANILAVPLVTLCIAPLSILGVLWPALWVLADYLLQGLMVCLLWLSSLPLAQYQTAMAPWWVGLAGVVGGFLLCLRLPWQLRLQGALCLLPLLLWQAPRPAQGQFDVLAADVGQGSAVLVRTNSHSVLFDTGPRYGANNDAGQRVLMPLLAALNEKPDRIVISHSDSDHAGGAASLMQQYSQASVMGSLHESHPLQQLRPIERCIAGQQWTWDGVDFSILHPLEQNYSRNASSNSMSCVLRISNGQRAALLAGDIFEQQERAIVARQHDNTLRADVLLAAHHGSKTSNSMVWLQAVQPQWVLIQQGYRNRYNHPHPQVLQRFAQNASVALQSDQCGAMWWQSRDNTVQCERDVRRHYWQHSVGTDASMGTTESP